MMSFSIENVQFNCIPSNVYIYYPELNIFIYMHSFEIINIVIHIICMLHMMFERMVYSVVFFKEMLVNYQLDL